MFLSFAGSHNRTRRVETIHTQLSRRIFRNRLSTRDVIAHTDEGKQGEGSRARPAQRPLPRPGRGSFWENRRGEGACSFLCVLCVLWGFSLTRAT
jgi:hypothetical protein